MRTQLLSREYCESLGDEDKQALYKQVIDEAKGKSLRELKQLSRVDRKNNG